MLRSCFNFPVLWKQEGQIIQYWKYRSSLSHSFFFFFLVHLFLNEKRIKPLFIYLFFHEESLSVKNSPCIFWFAWFLIFQWLDQAARLTQLVHSVSQQRQKCQRRNQSAPLTNLILGALTGQKGQGWICENGPDTWPFLFDANGVNILPCHHELETFIRWLLAPRAIKWDHQM